MEQIERPIGKIGPDFWTIPRMRENFDYIVDGSVHDPVMRDRLQGSIDDALAFSAKDVPGVAELGRSLFIVTLIAHGLTRLVRIHADAGNSIDAGYYHDTAQTLLETALDIQTTLEHKGMANTPEVSSARQ